ncbi:unnamed protein product [Ilex paraguariensis]|uniref:Uncharacterized protein n=1 Tax=Ilex paraguariensis TaxID=185542 RepID=A0ABC8T9M7_9AQUA
MHVCLSKCVKFIKWKASFGNIAAHRRRQHAVTVGKERREALIRTKRLCIVGVSDDRDFPFDSDMITDEEQSILEAQASSAVETLKLAVGYQGKGAMQKRVTALRELRRLLSRSEFPPVQAALEAGAIPILVQCLSFGSPDEQEKGRLGDFGLGAEGGREKYAFLFLLISQPCCVVVYQCVAIVYANSALVPMEILNKSIMFNVGNIAAHRRRQHAVTVGKERREALIRTKRLCIVGVSDDRDFPFDSDMITDEEQSILEAQASSAVETLKLAVGYQYVNSS